IFQPLGELADRLFKPPRKVRCTPLAGLDALHDVAHGLGNRGHVDLRRTGRELRHGLVKGGLREARLRLGRSRLARRLADFVRPRIHDDLIEPGAKRDTGTMSRLFGSFARFGLYALYAPRYTRS